MVFNGKNAWTLFFSGTGLVFALCSLLLILRVNRIRDTVENHVADIGALSRLEAEVFSSMNAADKDPDAVIIRRLNKLVAFPDVPVGTVDFAGLKAIVNHPGAPLPRERLLRELILVKKTCQYTIGENRQQLRLSSEKLLSYWNYTHGLLIFASVLLLALPILLYRAKSRKLQAAS